MAFPVAAAVMAGGSILSSYLASKKNKNGDPVVVAQTDEEKKAAQELLKRGTSGELGYTGELGSYDPTDVEVAGQNKLLNYVNSGENENYALASKTIKDLLSTDTYNPYGDGVYSSFKSDVLKEGREATDRLKRSAAITGGLYSTGTIQDLGGVEENVTGQLNSKLASLYQDFVNQKLSALGTAVNLGSAQEGSELGKIGAASQFGGLYRTLADEKATDKYNEFVRTKDSENSALSAAMGSNAKYMADESGDSNTWDRIADMLATGSVMGYANSLKK